MEFEMGKYELVVQEVYWGWGACDMAELQVSCFFVFDVHWVWFGKVGSGLHV